MEAEILRRTRLRKPEMREKVNKSRKSENPGRKSENDKVVNLKSSVVLDNCARGRYFIKYAYHQTTELKKQQMCAQCTEQFAGAKQPKTVPDPGVLEAHPRNSK